MAQFKKLIIHLNNSLDTASKEIKKFSDLEEGSHQIINFSKLKTKFGDTIVAELVEEKTFLPKNLVKVIEPSLAEICEGLKINALFQKKK